jgi:hypothetical protein
MENEIDLIGVDPARWPEIRRRVAILDDYVAIARPTIRQTDSHATRMGLRRSTFYALARIWREDRDPRKVAGAGASKGRRARNETNDLPQTSTDTICAVIADLGPWAEDRLILRESQVRLAAIGGRASDQAVRLLIEQTRARSTDRSPFPAAILIERCHLRLPMVIGDKVELPAACLAVAVPENTVIAHRLGSDADPPNAGDVLADIRALAIRGAGRRVIIAPGLEHELPEGVATAPEDGLESVRLRRVLGGSIDGINFLVQRRAVAGNLKPRNRFEAPLRLAEVDVAVKEAIDRHNTARGGMPIFSL